MTKTRRQPLRWLISLLTGAYALGLLIFVVLRLIFGDSLWWLAFFGNLTPVYFAALIVLLPLALLFRAKRGVLLMLPLVLIGAVWYGQLYLPKAAVVASSAETIKVVSFNVWGDNPDLTPVEDWLRDQAADVVVTIELPPAWNAGIPALRDVYPEQITGNSTMLYWGGTLLTQHPVVSSEVIDLGDGVMRQQRVVIDVAGQQIAVYAIYLLLPLGNEAHIAGSTSFYTSVFSLYDASARDAQIHALLVRLRDEPLPYIVAGDFNLSDQSVIYNDLAAALGDSFREAGTGLGTSWPMLRATFGLPSSIPPLVRIDYIWHSADFRAVTAAVGPFLGSDHLPMLATLALE